MKKRFTVVITGGHLTPALATAEAILELSPSTAIVYLGEADANDTTKPEILETKALNIGYRKLISGKLHRFLTLANVLEMAKIPVGLVQALWILVNLQPDVVVSFGGYLALPVVLAAKMLSIPLVIHEQTTAWGAVNKLTRNWAKKSVVSWPELVSANDQLVGNPIRKQVLSVRRSENIGKPVLYITGGHQGSMAIDNVLVQILPKLLEQMDVYHQGKNRFTTKFANYHWSSWYSTKHHAEILKKASLAIGRAGANTICELAYLGIPGILIPLPIAGAGEQLKNANRLAATGLVTVIEQSDLTPDLLLSEIIRMSHLGKQELAAAIIKSKQLIIPDAAGELAKIIISIGNRYA